MPQGVSVVCLIQRNDLPEAGAFRTVSLRPDHRHANRLLTRIHKLKILDVPIRPGCHLCDKYRAGESCTLAGSNAPTIGK